MLIDEKVAYICIASCEIRFSTSAYFPFDTPAFFQGLAAAYCLRVMPRMAQGFSGGGGHVDLKYRPAMV